MAKAKKAKPAKRKYTKKNEPFWGAPLEGTSSVKRRGSTDTFQIEVAPPPLVRGATAEKLALLTKVDRTMANTKPGQAFIIPISGESTIKRHLKREYPNDRFSFTKIADNPDGLRVYLLHPLPKGGKK